MILLLSALCHPAFAADVLWYQGNSGNSGTSKSISTAVTAVGSTGVDSTSTWPSSLSSYELVFLVAPATAFDAGQVTDLDGFISGGGTLVLIGDHSGVSAGIAPTLTTLLSDLGLSSSYTTDALDPYCSTTSTIVDSSHPVVAGMGGVGPEYAYSCDVTLSSGATQVLSGDSGQTILAVEGQVVLTTDINIFDDSCTWGASNTTLVQNLYQGLCSDSQDLDLDGYVDQYCGGDDCDDGDADIYPGATELCDGVDQDCDGVVPADEVDGDEDGFLACEDCDDTDPLVLDYLTWYEDLDGDGDGTLKGTTEACDQPEGYSDNSSDCDDGDPTRYQGADEVCDGDDEDCDGQIDEDDAVDAPTWYPDADEDGYGVGTDSLVACEGPSGWVDNMDDCDDAQWTIHPGAEEYCDARDQDCDGEVDEDATDAGTWYPDEDGDGYGDPDGIYVACDGAGGVSNADDCDDTDVDLYPGAPGYDDACLALEEFDPGNANDDSDDKGGCACSAASGPRAGLFALALGLAGLLRRRRPRCG